MSSATPAPTPWEVRNSELIVADRWIRLRADECVDAAGRTISPYYVLDPAEWISVLALNFDGEAIVVEEYRHGAGCVHLPRRKAASSDRSAGTYPKLMRFSERRARL